MKFFKKTLNLKIFLKNPTYSTDIQKKLFSEIANIMKFDKTLKNFINLIIKKEEFIFR